MGPADPARRARVTNVGKGSRRRTTRWTDGPRDLSALVGNRLGVSTTRETVMRAFRSMFASCALFGLALSGCGDGDGSSPQSSVSDFQTLTGAAPPIETAEVQSARAAKIVSRTDSLILSTVHGNTDQPTLPSYQLRADCAGTRCAITEPGTGFSQAISPSTVQAVPASGAPRP